jgi:hypothetical protein
MLSFVMLLLPCALAEVHGWDAHLAAPRTLFERVGS